MNFHYNQYRKQAAPAFTIKTLEYAPLIFELSLLEVEGIIGNLYLETSLHGHVLNFVLLHVGLRIIIFI